MKAPIVCPAEAWPPDYRDAFAWRQRQIIKLRENPALVEAARVYYRERPAEFILHWMVTYDPRNAGRGIPTRMPFIMFQRQADFVLFLRQCLDAEESGLVEKARDMGATWIACAFSVWLWLFWPGSSVGWGSRKAEYVDKLGDPDSIFEKMRMLIRNLPEFFRPEGYSEKVHAPFMRLINEENGSSITGESGDNIGRGGRKLLYFKDESAHYERPEKIEAALMDNTRVQIDISSVNGLGNVFHRRRENGHEWVGKVVKGRTNVFVMDWRDHPAKDQAWYDARRKKAQNDGLIHKFEQEVNRNYSAAIDNLLIPAEWVNSAIDLDKRLGLILDGRIFGGLDVADGGLDKNAAALRKGIGLIDLDEWTSNGVDDDVGQSTLRAFQMCAGHGSTELQYDSIGIGAGVKSEANRLKREGLMPKGMSLVAWSAADSPIDKDKHVIPRDKESPLNGDFYANLKAQAWWQLRLRFERTHRAVTEDGFTFNPADLISIPSTLLHLEQLKKELSQPTRRYDGKGRLVVEKTPEGTKSPNCGDAVVMAYWPLPFKNNVAKFAALGAN